MKTGQLAGQQCVTENDLRRDLAAPIRLRYAPVAGPGVKQDDLLLKRLGTYNIHAF